MNQLIDLFDFLFCSIIAHFAIHHVQKCITNIIEVRLAATYT